MEKRRKKKNGESTSQEIGSFKIPRVGKTGKSQKLPI
jgi:hypothetical protein